MGDSETDDTTPPNVNNRIEAGELRGPVGQFGIVNGDVRFTTPSAQDPKAVARELAEALSAAEAARARKEREEEEARRQKKEDHANASGCLWFGFLLAMVGGPFAGTFWHTTAGVVIGVIGVVIFTIAFSVMVLVLGPPDRR